jgi:hypothetical protein
MVAVVRPDSWNFPLFLHVLGAILTAGGTAAVIVVGFGALARRPGAPEQAQLLLRIAFRTLLFVVIPSFILMRVAAQWIQSKEYPDEAPNWVGVGFFVTEPGLLVLIPLIVVAGIAVRRRSVGRLATAVPVLASIYLAALAVAWWAMSAKPGL